MTNNQSQPGFLQSLKILFFGLLVGQIAIFVILWFLVPPNGRPGIYQEPFDMALVVAWLVLQASAYFLIPKRVEAARSLTVFSEKISAYRAAQVARFALMESAVLICLVGYFFVSANYVLLALAAVGIGLFILQLPTREKIIHELDLPPYEERKLDEA